MAVRYFVDGVVPDELDAGAEPDDPDPPDDALSDFVELDEDEDDEESEELFEDSEDPLESPPDELDEELPESELAAGTVDDVPPRLSVL